MLAAMTRYSAFLILLVYIGLTVDLKAAQDTTSIPAHITRLAWRPDGSLLAVGTDKGVQLLDPDFRTLKHFDDETGIVLDLVWSHDRYRLAVSSRECGLQIWQIDAETRRMFHEGTLCWIFPEWSRSGRWLAFRDQDHRLWLIDTNTSSPLTRLAGEVTAWEWHPQHDWLALALTDNTVRVLDVERGEFIWRVDSAGTDISWAPDGSSLAAIINSGTKTVVWLSEFGPVEVQRPLYHGVRVWNLKTNRIQVEIRIEDITTLSTLDWLPGNLIGGYCRTYNEVFHTTYVCLWDSATNQRYEYGSGGATGYLSSYTWSPDGSHLSVERFWKTSSTSIYRLDEASSGVHLSGGNAVWSPDSQGMTMFSVLNEGILIHYDTLTNTSMEYRVFDWPDP